MIHYMYIKHFNYSTNTQYSAENILNCIGFQLIILNNYIGYQPTIFYLSVLIQNLNRVPLNFVTKSRQTTSQSRSTNSQSQYKILIDYL